MLFGCRTDVNLSRSEVRTEGVQIIKIAFAFVRVFHVRKVPCQPIPNQRDNDDVEDDFACGKAPNM